MGFMVNIPLTSWYEVLHIECSCRPGASCVGFTEGFLVHPIDSQFGVGLGPGRAGRWTSAGCVGGNVADLGRCRCGASELLRSLGTARGVEQGKTHGEPREREYETE